MRETAGFYKVEGDGLLYGPHYVLNMAYELRAETYTEHTYPVDGWYWFDSETDAYTFFDVDRPTDV